MLAFENVKGIPYYHVMRLPDFVMKVTLYFTIDHNQCQSNSPPPRAQFRVYWNIICNVDYPFNSVKTWSQQLLSIVDTASIECNELLKVHSYSCQKIKYFISFLQYFMCAS